MYSMERRRPYQHPEAGPRWIEDILITFGSDTLALLLEVKSGVLSRELKTLGTVAQVFEDGQPLDKALRQLSRGVADIRAGLCDRPGSLLSRYRTVVPLVITYEPYYFYDVFRKRLDDEAKARGLQHGNRVARVGLMSFADLDLAEAIEMRGSRWGQWVARWLGDGFALPFHRYVGNGDERVLDALGPVLKGKYDRMLADVAKTIVFKEGAGG